MSSVSRLRAVRLLSPWLKTAVLRRDLMLQEFRQKQQAFQLSQQQLRRQQREMRLLRQELECQQQELERHRRNLEQQQLERRWQS